MFLVNNLLFVLFTFTVLIGTVFPLVVEATRGVQMSVGRPYFDRMAVPIGVALLFLMGVGPALPWGRATGAEARRALVPPLVGAAVAVVSASRSGVRGPWTLVDDRLRRLHHAGDAPRAGAAGAPPPARAGRGPGPGAGGPARRPPAQPPATSCTAP